MSKFDKQMFSFFSKNPIAKSAVKSPENGGFTLISGLFAFMRKTAQNFTERQKNLVQFFCCEKMAVAKIKKVLYNINHSGEKW